MYNGRVRWRVLLAGLFTLFIAYGAVTFSHPKCKRDLLKQQIVDALKKEDVKTALAAFDKYHALNVKMPPPLMFLEAKAAWAAGDSLRAYESLEAFQSLVPGRQAVQRGADAVSAV
ncbi:MAG: hypothetical protein IPG06_20605 [Haliea sp.]|nr:hypothetical protein [Haliea sp.]